MVWKCFNGHNCHFGILFDSWWNFILFWYFFKIPKCCWIFWIDKLITKKHYIFFQVLRCFFFKLFLLSKRHLTSLCNTILVTDSRNQKFAYKFRKTIELGPSFIQLLFLQLVNLQDSLFVNFINPILCFGWKMKVW